jgi:hypothetical protein
MFDLTGGFAWEHAESWCGAWNDRDLEAVMSHYAEDVAFCSPTVVKRWGIGDGWLHGKARLRENFAIGIEAPALRFDLVDVLTSVGSMCIIYRRETGQLVADTVELDDEGKAVRVLACYADV